MTKRNILCVDIVFDDLTNVKAELCNIGLFNMIATETVVLSKQTRFVKELDLYLLNMSNSSIETTEYKKLRHLDVTSTNGNVTRYYAMGKKEYSISISKNEFGDIIFSAHQDLKKLDFSEVDREEIIESVLIEVINLI